MCAWTTDIHDLTHRISDLGRGILDDELIVVLTNNLPDSYQLLIIFLELVGENPHCQLCHQGKEGDEGSLAILARNIKQKTP